MSNLMKVLFNLTLYAGILFIGIKIVSKVFDKGTHKFMSLNKKKKWVLALHF